MTVHAIRRSPGWDSKVRHEARHQYGSLRALADHYSVNVDDIGYATGDGMRVWSRLVDHFGSTEELARQALDIEVG